MIFLKIKSPIDGVDTLLTQNFPTIFQEAWIDHRRDFVPSDEFKNGDGFDVYVDASRFLPDCCAVTKVRVT